MIFEHRDLKLYYTVHGTGTPILMLHGRPTDHRAMLGAFEPIFTERTGWQPVYVDLPGMGQSSGKQINVVHEAGVANRMDELLEGLKIADREKSEKISQNYQLSYLSEPMADYGRPMLIMTGKQDIVTGYETANEWHKRFPRATFVALDRAGHGLHLEQTALFNGLTHDWLNRMQEEMALGQSDPSR